jgi:indole-3-glycerol phosphate synthase
MNVLETIMEHKRREIAEACLLAPLEEIKERARQVSNVRPFPKALRPKPIALIAEIKKASPSRGLLVSEFDHRALAMEFEQGGARALSVLTDRKFFQGEPRFIQEIKSLVQLPILRKDFIIDEYQVYESKAIGADAILLIVRALDEGQLRSLYELAQLLELHVVVETHSAEEILVANALKAEVIGINNRDLATFEISLARSLKLRGLIRPGAVAVSESGIRTPEDIGRLAEAGFDAILVGEGLVADGEGARTLRLPREQQ